MIVISSAELRNNIKKYLDLATMETVVIQRGRTDAFVLLKLSCIWKQTLSGGKAVTRN
jgi:hypothetical protein